MPKQKIDPYAARERYERGQTVQSIADDLGVSRVAIWKAWQRIGYSTDGLRFKVKCERCGKPLQRRRSDILNHKWHFCNPLCYSRFLSDRTSYRPWRQGSKRARAAVAKHFSIPAGAVVDHRNGDCRDNDLTNLRVYASQADHMAMHRGKHIAPIWDGRNLA
jgi:hypothetical protein